jgi:hypothetical protein
LPIGIEPLESWLGEFQASLPPSIASVAPAVQIAVAAKSHAMPCLMDLCLLFILFHDPSIHITPTLQ